MIKSLALIILVGLGMAYIFRRLNLPSLIGMLLTGILLGPYSLDLLDEKILSISGDLRQIALIIILLRAGFSLDLDDLKKVGRPAALMTFLPASFEIIAYLIFSPLFFGISRLEGAIMGAVLAAVSPAVVVPRMVHLIEGKWGTRKAIPQMVLAGSSIDDIFVIVMFTSFLGIARGQGLDIKKILGLPISIGMGILLGISVGVILYKFFERAFEGGKVIRNSEKVVIILGISFLLLALEDGIKDQIPLSGLLAIISMAGTLRVKSLDFVSERLSEKFGKLWIGAEVLLFVLVGSEVDITYTLEAGVRVLILILIALIFRSLGVVVSLIGTELNIKERFFCIIAYLPKATVQAAIGSIPLSIGLECGALVLSVAVLGILITAPLGAIGIDFSYKKLLVKEDSTH